jgi:predicted nucleic acid-binding protein
MSGYTLDTGALIALERRRQRMLGFLAIAKADKIPVVVPSVCIAEWWRGRTDVREKILAAVIVEHTDDMLVRLAGVALATVPAATCIDAMVMASAARRGGVVFTSDVGDMSRLQRAFPSVRVLGV